MSEIIPKSLYLGDYRSCSDRWWLKSKGITHIVNATKEVPNFFPGHFEYLQCHLDDHPAQDIEKALEQTYDYIENALMNGGIVLVHCYAGVSRSSSIVINYLMKKHNKPFHSVYGYVRSRRPCVKPNQGFVVQLLKIKI